MKLKSVSTYCQSAMSAGLIYTRDENGEIIRQHLVCRQMIVPLDGMPVISGDQLPALLDVPEEKRDAWFVSRIERDEGTGKELSWMLEDRQPGDILAILLPMTLAVNDVIVQPVMDEAGVARMQFVRVDALKVTDDIKKERTYALRSRDGRTVLMVMKGMTARAAIMTDTAWISEAANEWLECLSNEAARVVRERGKDERAEEQ